MDNKQEMLDQGLIQKDIEAIVSSLRVEDREYIRALPENRLILLHHTLGRTLRNAFRKNTYPYLFTHCDQQKAPQSRNFDSVSQTALRLIWEHLRDTPPSHNPAMDANGG